MVVILTLKTTLKFEQLLISEILSSFNIQNVRDALLKMLFQFEIVTSGIDHPHASRAGNQDLI